MSRNTRGLNWDELGPRVLAWLREYVKVRGIRGAIIAAVRAFEGEGVTHVRLSNYVRGGHGRKRWDEIRALAPAEPDPSANVPPAPPPAPLPEPVQEVKKTETQDGIEARSNGRNIKTVDDLLRHIEADMAQFEVVSSEATKYEGLTKNDSGEAVVTEMFRVFVRLKPRKGPSPAEIVETLLASAMKGYSPPVVRVMKRPAGNVWQVIVIADPHFGKFAWRRSTGGPDYDLGIARRCVLEGVSELLHYGASYPLGRRTMLLLGDVFHYDTPDGTTTAGTRQDRDGRHQKMLDVGADTVITAIELSAETMPTDVVAVTGNHDEIIGCAFQRILVERFRNDERVTIDREHTYRKYLSWGGNLIGISHGDEAKKHLPTLMSLERPKLWGEATYREIMTGHLHHIKAEQKRIENFDGVMVRTAPSVSPADNWHAKKGYIGAIRGMEAFFYCKPGGLIGSNLSSPDVIALKEAA